MPTDYPQFPRYFVSRNQFLTGEYRHVMTPKTLATYRLGYSRTRVGQQVEANTTSPLQPFVPGRTLVGNIDVGGLNRFGTQSSVDVRFLQQVISLQGDLTATKGRHLLKVGGLAERYLQDMVNPTFSLGTYSFANVRAFLENRATSFIGLTPQGQFDRYWRFWLLGGYVQDEFPVTDRFTVNAGVRYEVMTLPRDINGRDSALINLSDGTAATGQLYESSDKNNVSPRAGFAWDLTGDGRTSLRGGYGMYFNTNSSQNLIVTVTNPPATPRVVFANPTFPNAPFERASGLSVRPIQWDIETPRVQVWNVNVQRELGASTSIMVGYAGSRGEHLLRSNDVNTAQPTTGADGRPFFPAGAPRINPAWTTIELKSSDGDSWYRALVFEVRRRWSQGFMLQSSYTWSKAEDTTQASTFFSDATNGTTSAFPEFIPDYNKGLSDFHAEHNWVMNFSYHIPFADSLERRGRRAARRLARLGHRQHAQRQSAHGVRAEQPLAIVVAAVARPRHRAGSTELRCRVRRRQRHHRRSHAVVQPRRLRPATRWHVRQHGTRRLHRARLEERGSLAREGHPVDPSRLWWTSRSSHRDVQHLQSREFRLAAAHRLCRRR